MELPRNFKNFYERINDFLPPHKEGEITDGGKGFTMDIHDVKRAYTYWMEEILVVLSKDISEKKMEQIRSVINASTIDVRQSVRERKLGEEIKSLKRGQKMIETDVEKLNIPAVINSLDLRELERKLDEALGKETRETLTEWIKRQRQ